MDLLKKYALFFVVNRWYFKFFWGFTYKRSNEINFQFGFLLSNNKTYDPDVCHGGNFSKDFYKLKKSYHESTF